MRDSDKSLMILGLRRSKSSFCRKPRTRASDTAVATHAKRNATVGARNGRAEGFPPGTWLGLSGAALRRVKEILGHASPCTTEHYTHLFVADLAEEHCRSHPPGKAIRRKITG